MPLRLPFKGEVTVNDTAQAAVLAIWQRYHDRDYWEHYNKDWGIVPAQIKSAYQRYGDNRAEQGIIDHWRNSTRGFVLGYHRKLTNRFASGDIHWLKRTVRYDQPVMLELCELITGRKFKGLSNKKLALLLEELCKPNETA